MPKREQIILLDKPSPGFNVNETVGLGGQNKKGDVLLVQAMFRYIISGLGSTSIGLPLSTLFNLPDVSGDFDNNTQTLISTFQVMNASKLLNVDHIIHPASYRNRNLNHFKPLMTISLLHVFARASAKRQGHSDYTLAMLRSTPMLLPWIVLAASSNIGGTAKAIGRP